MLELTGTGLSPRDVLAVARDGAKVTLAPAARAAMEASAEVVSRLGAQSEPAYGVSTGFGSLANVSIPPERRDELQRALATLAEEEREAIALRFGAELTVPEIAKLLGEPLTTVEGRVYRALRKLRGRLQ